MSIDVLSIFGHVIVADVFDEDMVYILQVVDNLQGATSHVDGKVFTLARLDAFLATVIIFSVITVSIRLAVIARSFTPTLFHRSFPFLQPAHWDGCNVCALMVFRRA